MVRYTGAPTPARRALRIAVLMWVPLAQARNSLGDAELVRASNRNGWGFALPAPLPVLVGLIAVVTPQDQSRTSMVFGNVASTESPGMPSMSRKKSFVGSVGTLTASADSAEPRTRPPRAEPPSVPARRVRRLAVCSVIEAPGGW